MAVYLISFSLWYFMQPSNFQINNKSNPGLHQFCFTSSCDWFRKLMPLSQPICCKTEMGLKPITNCSSCFLALFAPWLLLLLLFLFSLTLKLDCLCHSFINLTEWHERRVTCQLPIGYIKHIQKYLNIYSVMKRNETKM